MLGFLTVGHLLAATSLGGEDPPRLVLLAVIDAYALCAAILCVARMMFSPGTRVCGCCHLGRPGRLRHALDPSHRSGQRVRLRDRRGRTAAGPVRYRARRAAEGGRPVDHVFLAIIVLQRRRTVREALRAPEAPAARSPPLRNWLARVWHWIALALLAALWLAWAVEVPHGYASLLR